MGRLAVAVAIVQAQWAIADVKRLRIAQSRMRTIQKHIRTAQTQSLPPIKATLEDLLMRRQKLTDLSALPWRLPLRARQNRAVGRCGAGVVRRRHPCGHACLTLQAVVD